MKYAVITWLDDGWSKNKVGDIICVGDNLDDPLYNNYWVTTKQNLPEVYSKGFRIDWVNLDGKLVKLLCE